MLKSFIVALVRKDYGFWFTVCIQVVIHNFWLVAKQQSLVDMILVGSCSDNDKLILFVCHVLGQT